MLVRGIFASLAASSIVVHAEDAVQPLRVHSLVPAVLTPFAEDGSVALSQIPEFSKYLKSTGVNTIFIGGTTGESLSLTTQERMKLTEAWVKEENITNIVHVGAESIVDAKALAAHAQKNGAAALGCMPSVFFKPATVEILAKWLKAVGESAPKIPLYYYHIPSMTGSKFMMLDLVKAVEKVGVPSFAGVKYTGLYETRAEMDLEQCMAYEGGKYEFLFGREEMTVEGLSIGMKGFIGSQFNFGADLYREIHTKWTARANYMEVQAAAQALLNLELGLPHGVNGQKLIVDFAGIEMGPARLPNIDADTATKEKFFAAVKQWCTETQAKFDLSFAMCQKHAGYRTSAESVVV